MLNDYNIVIVGLGYVGLPLAVSIVKKYNRVVAYDIDINRISELQRGWDRTNEITSDELQSIKLSFTSELEHLSGKSIYIVTVPTPVGSNTRPDLSLLEAACNSISKVLTKDSIVVFESTVYPGCTNEVCVPILESNGLVLNKSFSVGYSPERINPGDKDNTVANISKVIAGSNDKTLKILHELYSSIINAQIHIAESIETAEASKILENTQRDVNIALINEFEEFCVKFGLNIHDVLKMANTKWNFHNYYPGLVGGHCIGVDPYYLVDKAYQIGVTPELINSARRVNEKRTIRVLEAVQQLARKLDIKKIICYGLTFKANCPDFRNSKAIELVDRINKSKFDVSYHDPYLTEFDNKIGLPINGYISNNDLTSTKKNDCLRILLVEHDLYIKNPSDYGL